MATEKQRTAAHKNIKKAVAAARSKKSIASMPKETRSALGRQGAAVAQRRRSGSSEPKTKRELYEEAKERNIAGRSKMGRDELARALRGR
jgi:hypothetical protein